MDYYFDRPFYMYYNDYNTPATPLSSFMGMTRNYGGFFITSGKEQI
jgi:hypothetical protein